MNDQDDKFSRGWRARLQEIIFEADTRAGKTFDVVLIFLIVSSVIVVMLDSMASVQAQYGSFLFGLEWFFTIVFTVEYCFRLHCVQKPLRYAASFFGLVDLLAILPTYLSVFFPGGQALVSVRALRLVRIFRVFKLAHHVSASRLLMRALRASRPKLTVFLLTVATLVTVLGSTMYLVEGPAEGFTSIPRGVYWAIVTLTTVGYGDITPHTTLGQVIAALVMVTGYAIIAVPTGIVTSELVRGSRRVSTQACPACSLEGHDPDAVYCKFCGVRLNPPE